MHIYFIGQHGIPAISPQDTAEARVEALSLEALKSGYTVTIAHTTQYTNKGALWMQNAHFRYIPSLNPTIAGGYLYAFLSATATLFIKPNTIHVQGWKGAFFVRILLPFLGNTTTILTVSTTPKHARIARYIASGFDRVFSSHRTMQYRLLALYDLKTEYVPDGYIAPMLKDVRPAVFSLRKDGYGIILAQDASEIRKIVKACKAAKVTKKLVIFASAPAIRGCTRINVPPTSRSASSLVRQAAFVIAADSAYSSLLFQAMDAKRYIIATTEPIHEEILGTTASYFEPSDLAQMTVAIKTIAKRKNVPHQASTRAKNHFSWEKSAQEYLRAYRHNKTVLVPFDSIIPRNSFQRAV